MYSNLSPKNDRYALMEAALKQLDGVDYETVNAIIALHQTVYKPQFESGSSVASIAASGVFNSAFLVSALAAVSSKIAAAMGGAAIPLAGWVLAAGSLLWAAYDFATMGSKIYDEAKIIANEQNLLDNAQSIVEKNVANDPYAKYALEAANRTSEIMLQNGGTLLDKVTAVGRATSHAKATATHELSESDFAEKFGFTKDLNIIDANKALNHSLEFFYIMIGMNEYGNKVINKESYSEFEKMFEEYWAQNRDFLPYFNEEAARAKMMKEFRSKYYKDSFLPAFKKKLSKTIDSNEKNKSVAELAAEGRDEFGDIVDKEKYYASMGFRPDGKVIDLGKLSDAFMSKTGLDLNYNPVSDKGNRMLERMLKDPSGEYLKYLPAPVFLMTEEDQKPYIAKAKDPHRRGESMFGRYGDAMNAYNETSVGSGARQQAVNGRQGAQERQAGKNTNAPAKASAANDDITNSPDVMKNSGPWKTVGKDKLAYLYSISPDRHRRLMRLGYIMDINTGKFYRMSDDDRKVMPQVVYDELDEDSRQLAEKRRQVKLQQGRLTTADMTREEIEASNRRAGLPPDA